MMAQKTRAPLHSQLYLNSRNVKTMSFASLYSQGPGTVAGIWRGDSLRIFCERKEGRKGRRKTASFFGAPILLKYYYSLLWGPCQATVATTTSCCLSSNSFSNLCLDCFQFSGQHGLGGKSGVCTNDKVLNIKLVSYLTSALHEWLALNLVYSWSQEAGMGSYKTWNCIIENHQRLSLEFLRLAGMGN